MKYFATPTHSMTMRLILAGFAASLAYTGVTMFHSQEWYYMIVSFTAAGLMLFYKFGGGAVVGMIDTIIISLLGFIVAVELMAIFWFGMPTITLVMRIVDLGAIALFLAIGYFSDMTK